MGQSSPIRLELGGHGGGALGRFPDVLDVGPNVRRKVLASEHKVRGTEHDAHLIVGLVRYAARQPAERVHAVCLPEPLLATPAIGRIHADTGHVERLAALVPRDSALVRDPAHGSVRPEDPELVAEPIPRFERLLHGRVHPVPVIGVHPLQEARVPVDRRTRFQSVERAQILVPGQLVAVDGPVPDPHARGVHREAETLLALLQCPGRLVPLPAE